MEIEATVDDVFAALSDPTRCRVVELLSDGPRRSGELAEGVGVPATGLSRHLQVLRSCGLVVADTAEGDARGRTYSLDPTRLIALQAWLDQVGAFWTQQLGSFQRHVEHRRRGRTE
jgi:DNA-binding transcriptional ArsR family regulator